MKKLTLISVNGVAVFAYIEVCKDGKFRVSYDDCCRILGIDRTSYPCIGVY